MRARQGAFDGEARGNAVVATELLRASDYAVGTRVVQRVVARRLTFQTYHEPPEASGSHATPR